MSRCIKLGWKCLWRCCLCRSARRDLRYIGKMWQSSWRPHENRTWLISLFNSLLLFLRAWAPSLAIKWAIWPDEMPKSKRCRRGFIDAYVVVGVAIQIACLGANVNGWWLLIPAVLVIEMVVVTLAVRFVDPSIEGPRNVSSPNRSILLLLIGYAQVILAFAIFYRAQGGVQSPSNEGALKNAGDALWFSFLTITTLGSSDHTVTDLGSRLLVVSEIVSGLLLLALMLAAFLNLPYTALPGTATTDDIDGNGDAND